MNAAVPHRFFYPGVLLFSTLAQCCVAPNCQDHRSCAISALAPAPQISSLGDVASRFLAAVLVGFDEEVHLSCFSGCYILQEKYLFYLFEVDRSKIVDVALKLVA